MVGLSPEPLNEYTSCKEVNVKAGKDIEFYTNPKSGKLYIHSMIMHWRNRIQIKEKS